MTSPEYHYWRSKVGGLIRDRAPDDPELVTAKEKMAEEAFVAAVAQAMKKAPPTMSEELRQRVIALLS